MPIGMASRNATASVGAKAMRVENTPSSVSVAEHGHETDMPLRGDDQRAGEAAEAGDGEQEAEGAHALVQVPGRHEQQRHAVVEGERRHDDEHHERGPQHRFSPDEAERQQGRPPLGAGATVRNCAGSLSPS